MHRTATLAAVALIPIGAAAQQPRVEVGGPEVAPLVVITPTRLRQALHDVPASVTVITSATLARLGITSLPEALRLVPGMEITHAGGHDWRIGYHGTNILTPRRMNVLIDGVSMYRPGYSRVFWQQLPVAIADIDRIEVTRGPNSASYGPNSMVAIVNIITKHPKDVERGLASVLAGSNRIAAGTARTKIAVGSTSLRITASVERDGGYDQMTRSNPQGHDTVRLKRVNVRSSTDLAADTNLDLQAGVVEGVNEVPFVDRFQATFPDMRFRDYFVSGRWTRQLSSTHELKVSLNHSDFSIRQPWATCMPTVLQIPEMYELWRVDPSYVWAILAGQMPRGGSPQADALAGAAIIAIARLGGRAMAPTCATANQDIFDDRSDLEVQDTVVLSDALRLVSGIGARRQRVRSPTLFIRTESANLYRLFANAELKARPWLVLNVGAFGEHEKSVGWTWSPRAAANVRLADNQYVRLVLSKGTRTPDLYEQRSDWTYHLSGATPPVNGSTETRFFQSARSPGNLRPERIFSRELGYMLLVPRLGMNVDLKLFDDRLDHLISEKLQTSDFNPTNSNSARLSGAEVQMTVEPAPGWSAFVNHAYLRNRASTPLERAQYSRHSGAVGVSRMGEGGLRWSLAYYGSSGDGVGQNAYGRLDFTLGKDFTAQGVRCRAIATLSRLDSKSVTNFRDFGSTLSNRFDSRVQVRGQLDFSF